MNILFTGISSFTGFWFAKTLAASGHKIIAPLSGPQNRYDGVRRQRVDQCARLCQLVPETPFGTERFLELVAEAASWDVLCHHAADVTNYRSPEFDVQRALQSNTLNVPKVLRALQSKGLRAVVLTGSVFENDEGLGNEPLRAFSPYGLSKGLTWQTFRYYCGIASVPLTKFVIPNPFGPFEDERFTAYLARTWRAGKPADVKTPDYVRDNIPVDLLAKTYRSCVEQGTGARAFRKSCPSGYVESQGAFAQRVAREFQQRLGWNCELQLSRQEDFTEPLMRVNSEPARHLAPDWDEQAFWESFAGYYK